MGKPKICYNFDLPCTLCSLFQTEHQIYTIGGEQLARTPSPPPCPKSLTWRTYLFDGA